MCCLGSIRTEYFIFHLALLFPNASGLWSSWHQRRVIPCRAGVFQAPSCCQPTASGRCGTPRTGVCEGYGVTTFLRKVETLSRKETKIATLVWKLPSSFTVYLIPVRLLSINWAPHLRVCAEICARFPAFNSHTTLWGSEKCSSGARSSKVIQRTGSGARALPRPGCPWSPKPCPVAASEVLLEHSRLRSALAAAEAHGPCRACSISWLAVYVSICQPLL